MSLLYTCSVQADNGLALTGLKGMQGKAITACPKWACIKEIQGSGVQWTRTPFAHSHSFLARQPYPTTQQDERRLRCEPKE